jgi:hypothetical protein
MKLVDIEISSLSIKMNIPLSVSVVDSSVIISPLKLLDFGTISTLST